MKPSDITFPPTKNEFMFLLNEISYLRVELIVEKKKVELLNKKLGVN